MFQWARRTQHAGDLSHERDARSANISVDRRLFMLVLSELVTALTVVIAATVAFARLAEERAYMDRYVFAPLIDIGEAQIAGDELGIMLAERPPSELGASARRPILRLQAFIERYKRDWETGSSNQPDARRLRAELERQGEMHLLEEEHEVVGITSHALQGLELSTGMDASVPAELPVQRTQVASLNNALARLNVINLRYVQIGYKAFERIHAAITAFFIVVSVVGIVAAALFGFAVRNAIGPRVRRLVEAVKRFRERGVSEPIDDAGDDDLAVLAHTLGVSFRSIAERDRERERFLAVAAHELKTPLTSVKGFAQLALAHRDDPTVRERALSILDRQATRLARLVQDLLWSARANAGKLPFNPAPLDLGALAHRVIGELTAACEDHEFRLVSCGDAHIFGDVGLLEQSVWNLLIQAVTISKEHAAVWTKIDGDQTRVSLSIEVRSAQHLPDDLDDLIEPFAALPVERRNGGMRSTGLGLHLAREIARLHGASFHIARRHGDTIVSCLEFRR
jgi:signal transduction histidine kinase